MSEKMDRKNFMLALPAALTALVLHKSEEEPTVILEHMEINAGDHLTLQGFHVEGMRNSPAVEIRSNWKGKLKEHPRADEIEEKLERRAKRLEERRQGHEDLMGDYCDDGGYDGLDLRTPDPPAPRLADGVEDDST